jgi:hypothetical protein
MFASRVKLIDRAAFRDLYRYLFSEGRSAPLAAHQLSFSEAPRVFGRQHGPMSYTGASLVLSFLPDESPSIDATLRLGREFMTAMGEHTQGFAVYHGEPYEHVPPHLHLAITRPLDGDGHAIRYRSLTAKVKYAAADLRARHNFTDPVIESDRSYRSAMRGDEFTFYEWITSTGVIDELDATETPNEFFETAHAYGIDYRAVTTPDQTARPAYLLVDATASSFAGVRASKVGCAYSTLASRFGREFGVPPFEPSQCVTSYTEERGEKFPADLRLLHTEYREAWMRDTYPALQRERARVRAGCMQAIHHAHGLARDIAGEWPAQQRRGLVAELRELFRAERAAQLRDLDLSFPPRPPRRVGDWLRRLASPLPVPPAAVYHGAEWEPPASLAIDYGIDATVWHDGLRIGHFEGPDRFVLSGSDLRPETVALLPRRAERVELHPSLRAADLGLAPGTPTRAIALEQVPGDVRALLEEYQLPQSHAAVSERLSPTASPSQPGRALRRPSRGLDLERQRRPRR